MEIEAVNQAYDTFSKYKVSRHLDVCTNCCMTIEDERKLLGLPLKQISVELLSAYNDSAKSKKTNVDEIKHFLPRYLELISEYQFPSHSIELSLTRLAPFDKNEWKESELNIIDKFSCEFFNHCLDTYPIPSFGDKIDSIIIMFWKIGIGIDNLLLIWEKSESLESCLHFKDLYFEGFEYYNRGKLTNGFGDNLLCEKLTTWIQTPKTKEIMLKRIEKIIQGKFRVDKQAVYDFTLLYESLMK